MLCTNQINLRNVYTSLFHCDSCPDLWAVIPVELSSRTIELLTPSWITRSSSSGPGRSHWDYRNLLRLQWSYIPSFYSISSIAVELDVQTVKYPHKALAPLGGRERLAWGIVTFMWSIWLQVSWLVRTWPVRHNGDHDETPCGRGHQTFELTNDTWSLLPWLLHPHSAPPKSIIELSLI